MWSWHAGGSMANINGLSSSRSSTTWCAVLGAVLATVPPTRAWIGRCRWPHSTRSTWGWRRTISANSRRLEAGAIHVRDAGLERRMMHEDDGRAIGRPRQARRKPAQTLLAEQAADLARDERVEGDEPDWIVLDDVLDESTAPRQVPMVGERGDERVAIVMVPGNQVHGHRERRQQRPQTVVLDGASGVDQVPGRQHDVG